MSQDATSTDQPRPRLRSLAIKGMLWLSGQRIGGRILDQVFTIVMVRLLAPRDFGVLAMAVVFTGVLGLFTHSGISGAIVQRKDVDDQYLSTAFWANVGIGVILMLVAMIASRFVGLFMREPLAGTVMVVLSTRLLFDAAASTQAAWMSRHMNYRALSLRPLFATIVGGTLGVILAFRGFGVWSLVAQQVGSSAAGAAALYYAGGFRPRLTFSWQQFKDLWSFGGPLFLSRLFGYAVRNTDNLLVGRYLGSMALGFYALAYSVFLVPVVDIGFPMTQVMFSTLSRMQEDTDRLKRSFLLATRYITMIALPMMVGLSLVAPLLVAIVFGARWLPAGTVMSVLALAGFLQLMTALGPSALQAMGRTDLHMRWALLSVFLYLPAFAIGLRWGILGVATGYLIATMVLTPIQWGFVARVIGVTVRDLWTAVSPSVIGSVAMTALVLPARLVLIESAVPKVVTLTVLVLLGVAAYGGITWVTQRQALIKLFRMLYETRGERPVPRLHKAEESIGRTV
ncbi:MAG TPA: lipopolysaccharide biosynthesis protein [bacterium]|nr:lipopolysaccharide biosynthesis protein [bacterium]